MRVVDLFCKAGGASRGYADAFGDVEIVGVDVEDQPNYPYEFIRADAMTFDLGGFDFIHASPPCQEHSTLRKQHAGSGTAWMLQATIDRLRAQPAPWVVENVQGARMETTVRLCGSSFGLDVRRHRKFLTSFPVTPKPCDHAWQTPRFPSLRNNLRKEGKLSPVVGVHGHLQYAGEFPVRCKAMGIDWMTSDELSQAIPPAFTRYIGEEFLVASFGA